MARVRSWPALQRSFRPRIAGVHRRDGGDHLREVLAYQAGSLLEIADLLEPFLPDTASKIKSVFAKGFIRPLKGTLFPKHDNDTGKQKA